MTLVAEYLARHADSPVRAAAALARDLARDDGLRAGYSHDNAALAAADLFTQDRFDRAVTADQLTTYNNEHGWA
jgi:cysteine synthase